MARCDNVNARVGARRSRLLGLPGLRELLSRPNLAARVELLYQTDYGAPMRATWGPGKDPIAVAEAGLRGLLAEEAAEIERTIEGKRQRELFRAFFLFHDASNLKTVLRGVARATPMDRILSLTLPTPSLGDAALRELASKPTIAAAADATRLLAPAFHDALGTAMPAVEHRGLLELDLALDRAAIAASLRTARTRLPSSVGGRSGGGEDALLLRSHVRLHADLVNIATLIKMDAARSAGEFFLPGGHQLSRSEFDRIAALRPASAIHQSVRDWVRSCLGRAAAALLDGGTFALDNLGCRVTEGRMRREARARPLSLAVPLAFVLERRAEVRHVRLALLGTAFGLPAADMVEMMEA